MLNTYFFKKIFLSSFFFCFFFYAKSNNLSTLKKAKFIENKGQFFDQNYSPNHSVKYLFPLKNMNVELKQNGFSYDTFLKEENQSGDEKKQVYRFHRIDIDFVNANTNVDIVAEGPSDYYLNYFNAVTPEAGAVEVKHYQKITYKNIYNFIDVEFVANPGGEKPVEYNFILHPGADINDIKLCYRGMNGFNIKPEGIIEFTLAHGVLAETIPMSYWQESGKEEKVVYSLMEQTKESVTIGFIAKKLNINKTFIIDPTPSLSWSTYFGGAGFDERAGNYEGGDVCSDANENVIMLVNLANSAGMATSGAYQSILNGNDDAMLAKFSPSGTLLWATYYGGSGLEIGYSVEVDVSRNIFITGLTTSTNAIATAGTHQASFACAGACNAAFVTKFTSSGARIWGTYFYGNLEAEVVVDLTLTPQGDPIIYGHSQSSSGIGTAGRFGSSHFWGYAGNACFLEKFNSTNGTRAWGTYIASGIAPSAVDCDLSGNIYITGGVGGGITIPNIITAGAHQTINGGGFDAFIAKFDANAVSLLWGTLLGGGAGAGTYGGDEEGKDIKCDNSGNVYICGYSMATNNISTAGSHQPVHASGLHKQDAFLAKFNSSGVRQWGTYYGGTQLSTYAECAWGLAIDNCDNVVMIGQTSSTNNISSTGAYQTSLGMWEDYFITKFQSNGTRMWGTYMGGNGVDRIRGIDISPKGQIYVMGATTSSNMPVTPGAFQSSLSGGGDAFLFCLNDSANKPIVNASKTVVCPGETSTLTITTGNLAGAREWYWYEDGCGTTLVDSGLTHTVTPALTNTYYVRGEGDCVLPGKCDTIIITVSTPPIISITGNNPVCSGNQLTLTASGALSYVWSNSVTNTSITVLPTTTGNNTFSVTGTDANGCTNIAVATLTINPLPQVSVSANTNLCLGASALLTAAGGVNYSWSPAAQLNSSTGNTVTATPTATTMYTVSVIDNNGCANTATSIVTVYQAPIIAVSPNPLYVCNGASASLTATGASSYVWMPGNISGNIITVIPTAATTYTVTGIDNNNCSGIATATVDVASALVVSTSSITPICEGAAVTLSASASGGTGAYTYTWQPGNNTSSLTTVTPSTTTTYTLTVNDNCSTPVQAAVLIEVNPLPKPSFTSDKIAGCPELCVNFSNTTSGVGLQTLWNFGNGNTSSNVNVENCYTQTGTYSVTLTVTDANGCSNNLIQNNYITVHPLPLAKFSSSPSSATIINPTISFTDNSLNATAWNWNFGNGQNSTSLIQHPQHTYDNLGRYEVTLIVSNEFGCEDTAYGNVEIKQDYTLYMANTFTPNNDGLNDEYIPMMTGVENAGYEFYIYDRWGMQIFKSNVVTQGWDGRANGGTEIVQQDVYVWKLYVTDVFGKKHHYSGHVNLIR